MPHVRKIADAYDVAPISYVSRAAVDCIGSSVIEDLALTAVCLCREFVRNAALRMGDSNAGYVLCLKRTQILESSGRKAN